MMAMIKFVLTTPQRMRQYQYSRITMVKKFQPKTLNTFTSFNQKHWIRIPVSWLLWCKNILPISEIPYLATQSYRPNGEIIKMMKSPSNHIWDDAIRSWRGLQFLSSKARIELSPIAIFIHLTDNQSNFLFLLGIGLRRVFLWLKLNYVVVLQEHKPNSVLTF